MTFKKMKAPFRRVLTRLAVTRDVIQSRLKYPRTTVMQIIHLLRLTGLQQTLQRSRTGCGSLATWVEMR